MNNEQFRRLLFDNQSSKKPSPTSTTQTSPKHHGGSTPAQALGSRMRSSIPMTPRTVVGSNPKSTFAQQLAEHRRDSTNDGQQEQPPSKRFKSSSAPKGTRLPSGYQDRAQQRLTSSTEEEDDDDTEEKVKALEEMVKKGEIDTETFEKLKAELGVGGDLRSTHMVKGLDWELLRRVRAGEDVESVKRRNREEVEEEEEDGSKDKDKEVEGDAVDVDEEFDRVLEEKGQQEVAGVQREKREKKGSMAPPPPPPTSQTTGQKRSRDDILKQLKASRAAAAGSSGSGIGAQPAESTLGNRFKKVGESKVERKRWVEQDENGRRREVLQITDADGKTKRKVKWLDKPGEAGGDPALGVPVKDAKPLGMEVPAEIAAKAPPAPEEDDDIFEGFGADYNPLGDIPDEPSDSEEEGEAAQKPAPKTALTEEKKPVAEPSKPRNYFSTSTMAEPAEPEDRTNPLMKDPTLMAALKKAAKLRQASPSAENEGDEDVDPEAALRRKKFLEEVRRREAEDAMDMDMGFGGSRIEDEEDDETVLFEGRGGNKRKRGPKKRKGDKDSVSDVMKVMEGRKNE